MHGLFIYFGVYPKIDVVNKVRWQVKPGCFEVFGLVTQCLQVSYTLWTFDSRFRRMPGLAFRMMINQRGASCPGSVIV